MKPTKQVKPEQAPASKQVKYIRVKDRTVEKNLETLVGRQVYFTHTFAEDSLYPRNLTKGKLYTLEEPIKYGSCFTIINDDGNRLSILLYTTCAHLNRKTMWKLKA